MFHSFYACVLFSQVSSSLIHYNFVLFFVLYLSFTSHKTAHLPTLNVLRRRGKERKKERKREKSNEKIEQCNDERCN